MSKEELTEQKRKIKTYEELEFPDDFMFCKIMENNTDLCKELVELILSRKIGEIVSINRQKPIEITSDGKGVRFDVYMEDDTSTVYDIEMTTVTSEHIPKRMRYYQGMIDLNLLERGAKYRELRKSYIIFICCTRPFSEGSLHIYNFRTMCEQEPSLEFSDDACKVVLSAEGEADDVSPEMRQFLTYLKEHRAESDFTKRLQHEVDEARLHKKWRTEYMTLLERDERMREEGREEGRKEGRKEGREEATLNAIMSLMKSSGVSAEEAMGMLEVFAEEREKYRERL